MVKVNVTEKGVVITEGDKKYYYDSVEAAKYHCEVKRLLGESVDDTELLNIGKIIHTQQIPKKVVKFTISGEEAV